MDSEQIFFLANSRLKFHILKTWWVPESALVVILVIKKSKILSYYYHYHFYHYHLFFLRNKFAIIIKKYVIKKLIIFFLFRLDPDTQECCFLCLFFECRVAPLLSSSSLSSSLTYWRCNDPSCPSVRRFVGHNFLKGRQGTLPCSYRSTCSSFGQSATSHW